MEESKTPIRFLASVRSVAEAQIVLENGVNIIDCKEPTRGALGALDLDIIADICSEVGGAASVSATVGDEAGHADDVDERVRHTAATGVNFVKIGLDATMAWQAVVPRLGALDLGSCRLVAVLLADRPLNFEIISACADANFAGVLLDTVAKTSESLLEICDQRQLSTFVSKVQSANLFAGLAGSLRGYQIPHLAAYRPDILGFRGALCHDGARKGDIDPERVRTLREHLDYANQLHQKTTVFSEVI